MHFLSEQINNQFVKKAAFVRFSFSERTVCVSAPQFLIGKLLFKCPTQEGRRIYSTFVPHIFQSNFVRMQLWTIDCGMVGTILLTLKMSCQVVTVSHSILFAFSLSIQIDDLYMEI